MSDDRSTGSDGFLAGLMKAKPAKPGEIYGVPGQGESVRISAVVIVLLISFWGFVTYAGYIKPLFLPSPMGVVNAFFDVMKEGFTGVGFWEHIWVSTLRVFGAFMLACVIGIPLGIAMGCWNRVWIHYNQAMSTQLSGVFAASVTPLKTDGTLALDELPGLLDFLSERGCHGALLFGTTGEGPSFSPTERITLFRQALAWRETHPGFCLLAGTGTPSSEETVELTQAAFDLGMDGTVTLPPDYYRTVSDEGLFVWFSQTIRRAVPQGGAFFGYHFPRVSGVPLSIGLLERLKDTFPTQFAGIKDSSGDPELTGQLGQRFGKDLTVLTGSDRLFGMALENNASGCITALANLLSLDLRKVWDAFQHGKLLRKHRRDWMRSATSWIVIHQPRPC